MSFGWKTRFRRPFLVSASSGNVTFLAEMTDLLLIIYSLWLYACLHICGMPFQVTHGLILVEFSFPHEWNLLVLWQAVEDLQPLFLLPLLLLL